MLKTVLMTATIHMLVGQITAQPNCDFIKVAEDYDPKDRLAAQAYLQEHQARGEIPTGLLYLDEQTHDMHDTNGTVDTPLCELPFEQLCPGSATLDQFQPGYR